MKQPQILENLIKFCLWTLSSLAEHDFVEISLIEAIVSTHNCNILCLSETFLDRTIDLSGKNINANGYFISIADHPSNRKRVGICIHFKRS